MSSASLKNDIMKEMSQLRKDQQKLVLDFARSLTSVPAKGVKGKDLLKFAGCIKEDDLEDMKSAIKESCERVDSDEW